MLQRTSPLELYVARHGEYNQAVRNGGLTPEGYSDALLKAGRFAARLTQQQKDSGSAENHVTTILHAPSERTTVTAECFAVALGVTPDRMARLPFLDADVRMSTCRTREQLLESICGFIGPDVTRTLVVAHLGEVSDLAELDKGLVYNTNLIEPGYAEVYPVRLGDEQLPSSSQF